MPKGSQPTGQSLDLFLGAGSRRLQDGFKLRGIFLYSSLCYHEAKESTGTDPECTFQGV